MSISNSPTTNPDTAPAQVGGTHYVDQVIEPIVYAIVNKLGPLETKVIKYTTRHPVKNGLQDIRKAKHCLEMIEDFYYGPQDKLQETIDKIAKFMSENEKD